VVVCKYPQVILHHTKSIDLLFLSYFSQGHAGSECLFQPRIRNQNSKSNWLQLTPNQLEVASILFTMQNDVKKKAVEMHYRPNETRMLNTIQIQLDNVLKYERHEMQTKALNKIPLTELERRAKSNPKPRKSARVRPTTASS